MVEVKGLEEIEDPSKGQIEGLLSVHRPITNVQCVSFVCCGRTVVVEQKVSALPTQPVAMLISYEELPKKCACFSVGFTNTMRDRQWMGHGRFSLYDLKKLTDP